MEKLFLLLSTLLAVALPAFADAPVGFVTVSASDVQDSIGALVSNGTISFTPVNNSGTPISYRVNGRWQAITSPVTTLVTNGAFSIQLADTSLTTPDNVCYAVTIRNNTNGKQIPGTGYGCVQPSGSGAAVTSSNAWCTAAGVGFGGSCDFDNYDPNLAALVTVQSGPTGPAPNLASGTVTALNNGLAPTFSITRSNSNFTLNLGIPSGPSVPVGAVQGAWSSTTKYSKGAVVTFNGQSYISLAPSNLGNEPNTRPTQWGLLTSLSDLPSPFASQSAVGPEAATFASINSVPLADQFAGGDICAKIRAAATFALSAGIGQVDASHFSGTQACTTNMLTGLCAASANNCNLIVNLGAVHIQSSVAQSITNTGIGLHGMSPMQTQLEYVGASLVPAILTLGDTKNGETNNQITGIFIYGDNANATDGMLVQATFHSQFRDVWTWGVKNCGIHDEAGVTNTYDSPRTSSFDATALGINNSGHSQPASAWCGDQNNVGAMTGATSDDLLLNPAAEGVTGPGFNFINAINTVVTGGTSEDNQIGVQLSSNTTDITLITMDLEANTVNDILDNGHFNAFINVSSGSTTGKSVELGANSRFAAILGGAITSIQQDAGSAAATIGSGGSWSFPQLLSTTISGSFGVSGTTTLGTLNAGVASVTGLNVSANVGLTGALGNTHGVLLPATAIGNAGNTAGKVELVLQGTTGTITGTAISTSCDSGTATVTGAIVGHPVAVSSTSGADIGGAFDVRASVTAANTVTVLVCGTGTPRSQAYNVTVF
jgi:hypothetical protein